jgi:hypothetical protein
VSAERPEDRFELRTEPVGAAGRDRRRALVAMAAIVTTVGIAIGLAVASAPPKPEPRFGFGTSPGTSAPAIPGTTPRASSGPTARARTETLLPIASRPLPGAPEPFMVRQVGSDAEVHAWTPGAEDMRFVGRFPGAVEGDHESAYAFLSPNGRWLLVVTVGGNSVGGDTARLVDSDGRVAWESDRVTGFGGLAWSTDSKSLVVSGDPDTWWLLSVADGGDVSARELDVEPGRATAAPPSPSASSPGVVTSRLRPIGSSTDGSTIYGARTSSLDGTIKPAVAVAVADGSVAPISSYPLGGPSGLAPNQTVNQIVDPTTGRTASWGVNAAILGGPPAIEVRSPDATMAYRLQLGVTLGFEWAGDGRLVVLDADGFPFPKTLSLLPVAADGTVGSALVTTGPVDSGGILGLQGGYAVLVLRTVRPADETQIVVVSLGDGATSALVLPREETANIVGSGLLP